MIWERGARRGAPFRPQAVKTGYRGRSLAEIIAAGIEPPDKAAFYHVRALRAQTLPFFSAISPPLLASVSLRLPAPSQN